MGQILRKHSGGLRRGAGGMGRSHTTLRRQGAGKQIEQYSSYKIHKKGPSKLTFLLLEKEVRTKEKKKTALFSIFFFSLSSSLSLSLSLSLSCFLYMVYLICVLIQFNFLLPIHAGAAFGNFQHSSSDVTMLGDKTVPCQQGGGKGGQCKP